MASSMAGAFLWQEYSISAGETGASRFSRGCRAPLTLSQVAATSPPATSTPAINAVLTMAAMVFPASWSALLPLWGASSMPSTFSRSSPRAISSFSLKLRAPSPLSGMRLSVISISLMVFMVSSLSLLGAADEARRSLSKATFRG